LGRRRVRLGLVDQRSFRRFQAEAFSNAGRDRLHLDAEPAACHYAVFPELRDDHFHDRGRYVEADPNRAAGGRIDRSIYADDVAVAVEGRPARIALVDGGIDLDVTTIGTGVDVASLSRDDAGCHRAAKAVGVTDRDNPIADARNLACEIDIGKIRLATDLDERKVSLRVGADHFRRIDAAVISRDLNRRGVIDNVIVGHGIAVGGNEEAGADAHDDLMAVELAARNVPEAILAEEFLERRAFQGWRRIFAARPECICVWVLVDPYPHRNYSRLDLCDQVREARRSLLSLGHRRCCKHLFDKLAVSQRSCNGDSRAYHGNRAQ
jgi:hypothetical protein